MTLTVITATRGRPHYASRAQRAHVNRVQIEKSAQIAERGSCARPRAFSARCVLCRGRPDDPAHRWRYTSVRRWSRQRGGLMIRDTNCTLAISCAPAHPHEILGVGGGGRVLEPPRAGLVQRAAERLRELVVGCLGATKPSRVSTRARARRPARRSARAREELGARRGRRRVPRAALATCYAATSLGERTERTLP
jgi:hypothetical protein